MTRPNVLFIMTDQQRFDTIAALGNEHVRTPNLDLLVARGVTLTNAYSTCPVCVPARYTLMTGCEPLTSGVLSNGSHLDSRLNEYVKERCGPYLGQRMTEFGYRTFGVGKFHTMPFDADLGFDPALRSEELFNSPEEIAKDAYASYMAENFSAYAHLEDLMGERTEMYYVPQQSALPAGLTQEAWAADRVVEQLAVEDDRPFFGFLSFVGPHPPLAPPVPFNRLYDPDLLPDPVVGDIVVDHADDHLPWMNYAVWADDISNGSARVLKARYYGEITHIDECVGRVLGALDQRQDADNTVICFFADHGEHLGDHHSWQKESWFEASTRIPFLVSWPGVLPGGARSAELASLSDLFGVATSLAGSLEKRDGVDLLGVLRGVTPGREQLLGVYGQPGTRGFKCMLRSGPWKYVHLTNGSREQLFNVASDPQELVDLTASEPAVAKKLRAAMVDGVQAAGGAAAIADGDLLGLPFVETPRMRIKQFTAQRGVRDFVVNEP